MSNQEIFVHVAEVACAAAVIGWIFALLTWRVHLFPMRSGDSESTSL